MPALRHLLLILALLLAPRWAAADEEADLTAEVEQISRTVIADSQMAAEATVCPTQLMSGRKGSSLLPPMYCRVGNMSVCLAKCQEGTASACYWLAQVLEYKKAPETATAPLFQRACRFGIASGCTNRASRLLSLEASNTAQQRCAAATFVAACDANDPWACTMNAMVLSEGLAGRTDLDAALKSLEKSCNDGLDDPACTGAAQIRSHIEARKAAAKP